MSEIIVPLVAASADSRTQTTTRLDATATNTAQALAQSNPVGDASLSLHGPGLAAVIATGVVACIILGVLSYCLGRCLIRDNRRRRHELTKDMSFLPRDGFGAASRSNASRPSTATSPPPSLFTTTSSRPSTATGKSPLVRPDSGRRPSTTNSTSHPSAFQVQAASSASLASRPQTASSDAAGSPEAPTSPASHPFSALHSPTRQGQRADSWVASPTNERTHERQLSAGHRRTIRVLKALADSSATKRPSTAPAARTDEPLAAAAVQGT
ncbi:hypothetical protein BKA62DRAFT_770998 [Auriculariales sp. MPI-PUGE-AT-0066]|nr:hypothetical protein BKA62DRAFT_770998 [Auriculariales sp. MPI-PUGE-AT-0066]